MSMLTVWKFQSPDGAQAALDKLKGLQEEQLIEIYDAAIVTWPEGASKPKTKQLNNTTGEGAVGGMFWGLLFGLIFFIPLIGAAIGALTGALAGSLTDVGIDDDFIKRVRSQVTEGTSALFLMAGNAVVDRLSDEFKDQHPELIASNATKVEEDDLKKLFTDD